MILSNQKLIFIHIPKNAGTSIENFLIDKYYLKEDILIKIINYLKKYSKLTVYLWLYVPLIFLLIKNLIFEYHKKLNEYNLENCKDYKIFTVLRHPQDRIISFYYYFGFNNKLSFYDFLKNIYKCKDRLSKFIKRNQFDYLHCNQKCHVHILNYDNLNNDWNNFCTNNNLINKSLNILNKSDKHDKKILYSGENRDEMLKLVYTIYKKDFEIFNYKLKY